MRLAKCDFSEQYKVIEVKKKIPTWNIILFFFFTPD